MLCDIAEFDHKEAWRGDGALSMRDWLVAQCHVSRARARTLVESAAKARISRRSRVRCPTAA